MWPEFRKKSLTLGLQLKRDLMKHPQLLKRFETNLTHLGKLSLKVLMFPMERCCDMCLTILIGQILRKGAPMPFWSHLRPDLVAAKGRQCCYSVTAMRCFSLNTSNDSEEFIASRLLAVL